MYWWLICRIVLFDQPLGSPEFGMRGLKRVNAYVVCFLAFSVVVAIMGYLIVKLSYSRNAPRIALIPALSLAPAFFMYQRTNTKIQEATTVRDNFFASESELDSFANQIASGQNPNMPQKIGHFLITDFEMLGDGRIGLYTKWERNGWSRWGFVRDNNQITDSGPASLMGMKGADGQNNQFERLRAQWFLIYDRYWLVKVGWS
jgi:hypothetical protein